MKIKHLAIEIFPRALWIILGMVLLILHEATGRAPVHDSKDNIIGSIILILGIILTLWTFYHIGKAMVTKKLITSGPYKYSRHPMYISIYIMLTGVGILWFSWLWFLTLAAFIPLWYLSARLEEIQMTELFPKDYPKYKKHVPMFFPFIERIILKFYKNAMK
tara:strand:- start:425 stop:910 length:486 start_codon:yes stop_codon:yes gene_type:complete